MKRGQLQQKKGREWGMSFEKKMTRKKVGLFLS